MCFRPISEKSRRCLRPAPLRKIFSRLLTCSGFDRSTVDGCAARARISLGASENSPAMLVRVGGCPIRPRMRPLAPGKKARHSWHPYRRRAASGRRLRGNDRIHARGQRWNNRELSAPQPPAAILSIKTKTRPGPACHSARQIAARPGNRHSRRLWH